MWEVVFLYKIKKKKQFFLIKFKFPAKNKFAIFKTKIQKSRQNIYIFERYF